MHTSKSPGATANCERGKNQKTHGNDSRYKSNQQDMAASDMLLPLLDHVKQIGPNKWTAICPAHDDRHPSLAITQTDEGALLIKCWAGCGAQAIVESVGLSLRDLFPRKTASDYDPTKPRPKAPKFSKSELFDLLLIEAVILALSFEAIRMHGSVSSVDAERAQKAFDCVMRLHCEIYS
ncbi:MAG: hypothetical protein ABSB19_13410 [Methylomonas sp.]|jgi:hypothetical protein